MKKFLFASTVCLILPLSACTPTNNENAKSDVVGTNLSATPPNLSQSKKQTPRDDFAALKLNDVDKYIQDLPLPPPLPDPPSEPQVIDGTRRTQFTNSSRCETATTREGISTFQAAAFAPNADVLWPGSIVSGDSIQDGVLTPLSPSRGRGIITIDNIGLSGITERAEGLKDINTVSAPVESPSLSEVKRVARQLLAKNINGHAQARIAQDIIKYNSIEQAAIRLNASAKWLSGDFHAGLAVDSTKNQSDYIIKFVQSYYDISFQPPNLPRDFFAKNLKLEDIQDSLGGSHYMPAYVSTITYGRMLLLHISTSENEDSTKAFVNAAYNGMTTSGSISADLLNSSFVRNSKFSLLVLGGSPTGAWKLLRGIEGLKALPQYYKSGIDFSKDNIGVPISYQLRWLGTKNMARLTFSTDYQTQVCSPLAVTRFGVRLQTLDDDKDDGDIVTAEIYRGSELVWRWAELGRREHKWQDNTHQPDDNDADFGGIAGWFSSPPLTKLTSDQCSRLKARITKTGDRGWNFLYQAALWVEDGSRNGRMIEFMRAPTPANFKGSQQSVEYAANNCQ
ncbi:Thiol-activated cytolysin [Massilia sp. PDC64]|nr:thiol-activated cytolysin family protein [Massilia sp. PDC64]SDC26430.1 Thiol-activated cytolysin [Massilia sp. PDC64]